MTERSEATWGTFTGELILKNLSSYQRKCAGSRINHVSNKGGEKGMKLTKQEVETLKANYKGMIDNPNCKLQEVLARYWLERLDRKGKYAFIGE